MSLKQEIETWVAALAAYDNNEFDVALRCFSEIADTSKIYFNLGVINATLGEHTQAVEHFQRAVQLDQYFAVAYFQQGVSNFLMGDFEEALANFNDTLLYLRGNNNIDYEQLGLRFKLYSCEVLFNRGLCYIYLQQKDAGMQDLRYATREKQIEQHNVIDEAIREQAEGYTVFSIPIGVVYRPSEAKVKNLGTKDYLGKARLVAAQDQQNLDPRRQAALAARGIDDRPSDKLSYAALNLVKPDLKSRSRQQSEPPLQRTIFPPTPPPEPERRDSADIFALNRRSTESTTAAIAALYQGRSKPSPLQLGIAAFDQRPTPEQPATAASRTRSKRSESERPSIRRELSNNSTRTATSQRRREVTRSHQDVPEVRIQDDPIEAYSDGAAQTQQNSTPQRMRSSAYNPRQNQPLPISEEDEDGDGDVFMDDSNAPLAFEIVPPRSHHRRQPSQSTKRSAPDLRRIRIKVHAEDVRYVMCAADVRFLDLEQQVRQKFSLGTGAFKLKMKDEEGDLITLGDDDDLEMAVAGCKAGARKEGSDMGKLEVWVA